MAEADRPALELPPILDEVRASLPTTGAAWLVGGAVRDLLLGRRPQDFDFVMPGDALAASRAVADKLGGAYYPLDSERGVGRVIVDRDGRKLTLDFARLRGVDLAADLAARDFTINAIAVDLNDTARVIDPTGGVRDLRAKIVRAAGPTSIADDAVRTIRAVRFAAQLGFRLEPATLAEVRGHGSALASTSAERRRDEFMRCLGGPRPAAALSSLERLRLLPALAPELTALKGLTQSPPHTYDVWDHTLATVTRLVDVLAVLQPVHDVDAASDITLGLVSVRLGRHRQALGRHLSETVAGDRPVRTLLMLAALLHDVGKPATRTLEADGRIRFLGHETVGAELTLARAAELRLSTEEGRRVSVVVANHLRPLQLAAEGGASRRAIYRFFTQTGAAGVDIVLLSLADFLAGHGDGPPPVEEWNRLLDVCAAMLNAYYEQPQKVVNPPALLNGDDLIGSFGLKAGPALGELLAQLREAQAAGEVVDKAGAEEWVRARLT
jgi:putative nucleotidyltransferase with HDIG domain